MPRSAVSAYNRVMTFELKDPIKVKKISTLNRKLFLHVGFAQQAMSNTASSRSGAAELLYEFVGIKSLIEDQIVDLHGLKAEAFCRCKDKVDMSVEICQNKVVLILTSL